MSEFTITRLGHQGDGIAPPCRHFKSCGGCQLQHDSGSFVAECKVDVVRTALAAQGLETDLPTVITSHTASRKA